MHADTHSWAEIYTWRKLVKVCWHRANKWKFYPCSFTMKILSLFIYSIWTHLQHLNKLWFIEEHIFKLNVIRQRAHFRANCDLSKSTFLGGNLWSRTTTFSWQNQQSLFIVLLYQSSAIPTFFIEHKCLKRRTYKVPCPIKLSVFIAMFTLKTNLYWSYLPITLQGCPSKNFHPYFKLNFITCFWKHAIQFKINTYYFSLISAVKKLNFF